MIRSLLGAPLMALALVAAGCGGDGEFTLDVRVDGENRATLTLADVAEIAGVDPKRGERGPSLSDVLAETNVRDGDGTVTVTGDKGRYSLSLHEALEDDESIFTFTRKGTVKLETREGEDVRHARAIEVDSESGG